MKFTIHALKLEGCGKPIAEATGGTMRGSQWFLEVDHVSEIPNGIEVTHSDGMVHSISVNT